MRGERLGVVALEEAEVVELVVDGAAEERARRHAERAAERVPAGDLDPGEDDLRELRPHLPAALAPDRAQDRLHVAGRVADDLARHQLAVRDDRARVLADRLAVADDAVVGVDGEEDEVRADLRAARPVELLRERDRERRRLDARDPHGSSFSPKMATVVSPRSSAATISRSRSSIARAAASTVVGVGGGDDRDAVRVGADEVARADGDAASVTGTRSAPGPVLARARAARCRGGRPARRPPRAAARSRTAPSTTIPATPRSRAASATMSPQCAVAGLAADREHDHLARLGGRDGVVEREVVARRALHGERRPERVRRRPRRLEPEQDRDAVAAGRGEEGAADRHRLLRIRRTAGAASPALCTTCGRIDAVP